jgi:hypothetical protein
MKRITKQVSPATISEQVLDATDTTVLDVLDNLLNKGVMLNGDVTLGVAGVDLIYLRLSTLLCAADRIFGPSDRAVRTRPRRRLRDRRARMLKRRT